MVRTRVALGLSFAAAFLLLAWADSLLPGGPVIHALFGLLMVASLVEFYGLAERVGQEPLKIAPVALVVVFVALDYAARLAGLEAFGGPLPRQWATVASFYAPMGIGALIGVWVLTVVHLLARPPHRWLSGAPASICGFLYIWLIGAHVFVLRGMGTGYLLAFLTAAKVGDAGAYFVGRFLGRHRLAPRTSPNKTVEGALGGLAASALGSVGAAALFGLESSVGFWILFGLVVGLVAQVGDLVASAIKRSAGAKDSGNLFPTFGGILDLIDSALFSAPVALWLLAA